MAILRIWMCFEVVLDHFYTWTDGILNEILRKYSIVAVPIFMLSAFVFVDINKLVGNIDEIKKRIYRLVVPHVFWTFAYYLVYRYLDKKCDTGLLHGKMDIFWQLLFGHSYNLTLWFQVDLILLTCMFGIIFFVFQYRKAMIITLVIGYLALWLQYSEIVSIYFDRIIWPERIAGEYFSSFYVIWPLGRVIEMIPYAVLGIVICNLKILKNLKKYSLYIVLGSVLLLVFFLKFDSFMVPEKGFGYQGIYLIVIGLLTFLCFYFLPLNKLPAIIRVFVVEVSKYTMGIYFMHRLVATILYNTCLYEWLNMRKGSKYDCVIIFIISYLIARWCSKIPVKCIYKSMS